MKRETLSYSYKISVPFTLLATTSYEDWPELTYGSKHSGLLCNVSLQLIFSFLGAEVIKLSVMMNVCRCCWVLIGTSLLKCCQELSVRETRVSVRETNSGNRKGEAENHHHKG